MSDRAQPSRPASAGPLHARRALRYLWAAPATAAGLVAAAMLVPLGANLRQVDGVLEVACGRSRRGQPRSAPGPRFAAITLGHVVLGVDHAALAALRAHEHAHVRQYERWGPLFVALYLGSSLVALLRGRHPYHDNHFERQACAAAAVAACHRA